MGLTSTIYFRASGYGYQGAKNQADLLLSGIRGIGGVVRKVLTG